MAAPFRISTVLAAPAAYPGADEWDAPARSDDDQDTVKGAFGELSERRLPAAAGGPANRASVPAARKPIRRAPVPAAAPATPLQGYMDRLIKLIPAEVVGLYLVGVGMIPKGENVSVAVWALVCLALVVLVRAYGTGDPAAKVPPQWGAVAVASISFVIWVYNMPGPFQAYGIAVSYIGSLMVLVWTFVVPIFYKGQVGPSAP
jgi:hypothetical protein